MVCLANWWTEFDAVLFFKRCPCQIQENQQHALIALIQPNLRRQAAEERDKRIRFVLQPLEEVPLKQIQNFWYVSGIILLVNNLQQIWNKAEESQSSNQLL